MTTPYELVKEHYTFPPYIEDRDYQTDTVNALAPLPRAGFYLGGGTGKTFVATCATLHKKLVGETEYTIILMPPILLPQWEAWLNSISPKPKVLVYSGTPTKRKQMDVTKYDFILSSMQTFKNDFEVVMRTLRGKKLTLIIDEATSVQCSIKNVGTGNYKLTKAMVEVYGAHFMPLTATPLSSPLDGYVFVKLVSPSIYRNLNHFENVHVAEWGFFGKPTKWANLDLLRDNLRVNSVWLQRREIRKDLPPVVYNEIKYDLAPDHLRLYRKLVDEQLLEMPDGGKIDGTQENNLYHKLQQLVINYDYFSGDASKVAAGLELVERVIEELDGAKLIVVGNYRMTNRTLVERLAKFGAVAAYGDIDPKKQDENKRRFIEDPSCKVFILQPSSAGFGLDGLQHVCSDYLFLELPRVPKDFHQTVWRLDRDGQKEMVNVRIAVAKGTIQQKLLKDVLSKDDIVFKLQPNLKNLRAALLGED